MLNLRKTIKLIACLIFWMSTNAHAEFVTEIYGGDGFTGQHNAQVNLPNAGITGMHYNLQFDSAAIVGGRASYWFNPFKYFGLGFDVSHYFGPDQKEQTALTQLCVTGLGCSVSPEVIKKFNNNITVVGFDAMLRYPLGKLQPYVDVGPAIFITTLNDTGNFIPQGQSSTYSSVGIQAGAGLKLLFTPNIGAFVEYKEMNFQVDDTFYNGAIVHGITLGKTLGSATFNIQSIVAGGSWCF